MMISGRAESSEVLDHVHVPSHYRSIRNASGDIVYTIRHVCYKPRLVNKNVLGLSLKSEYFVMEPRADTSDVSEGGTSTGASNAADFGATRVEARTMVKVRWSRA